MFWLIVLPLKSFPKLSKPCIENQNNEHLLITTEVCKETGYEGVCNNDSISEQLCDNDFINCGSMVEIENKIDKYNEEFHQNAALNSTVNTPETTDSKTFETFKIGKTSTNVPNTATHSKSTKQKSTKTKTYEVRLKFLMI